MLSTGRLIDVFALVSFLLWAKSCVGQSGVYLSIRRQNDGDVFTRLISNASDGRCDRWLAVDVLPYSKANCTVQCKCREMYSTYSIRLDRCAREEEILKFENCNGSLLPTFGKPLYDFTMPGKAELDVTFLSNQSRSCIKTIGYMNGTNQIDLTNNRAGFEISVIRNGSVLLAWSPENSSVVSEIQGYLLNIRLICNNNTSQHQDSCYMIKSQGGINKKIDLTAKEHRKIVDSCAQNSPKSTNVMLLYILVGVGCACVLIVALVACYACYSRRRRLPRHATPRTSSRKSVGTQKAFKTHSVTKNNGPTTPAIHDVIFNELSWDNDGGFSNRALADPRILDVDYGIPIDFGTLPRPVSSTSFESTRNSLSPLTDTGEHVQRR